jgi:hypothetical protein
MNHQDPKHGFIDDVEAESGHHRQSGLRMMDAVGMPKERGSRASGDGFQ